MTTAVELLDAGIREQQAGRWQEAERLFREAVAREPANADAHSLLGGLALQAGHLPAALQCFQTAVRCAPTRAILQINLGEAFRRLGQIDEAIACNRLAVQLEPALPGAHANLGQLLEQQGDIRAAAEAFRSLVALCPNDVRARNLLGRALLTSELPQEAETHFRHALNVAPGLGRGHYNLGAALQAQSRWEEAADEYRAELAANPQDAEAQNNLGTVLVKLKKSADAERHYRQALVLRPDLASAYNNLGTLLMADFRCAEAVPVLQRAVALSPDEADLHVSLGVALQFCGYVQESIVASRRAIELDGLNPSPHYNLGISLQVQGRLDDAMAAYESAVRLGPECAQDHSNYLYLLNYHERLTSVEVFAAHRDWGKRHADPLTARSAPHSNDRAPDRRLRVGYVSAHFHNHSVNFFSEPILASHDRSRVEVFCYSNVIAPDDATQRLRGHADAWRDILRETDERTAEIIREDQIDILVDLSGHIGGNRLMAFAHKPAPVQVTYIGYQNTTGMAAMDYRLSDDYADPPGTTENYYTERLVRLPRAFFCYLPSEYAPPVGPLPAQTRGYVTFGSFNNLTKLRPAVLATWARLLQAVPNSRLTLLATVPGRDEELHESFDRHGIDPARVTIGRSRPRPEYLKLISETDIALDPFPFNGHTTTCDALWQGVPVVTLSGTTYASRFGGSALVALGLPELIASSPAEYIHIASGLAADLGHLAELRATLRERMKASPLLDFPGFTRNLESAYRQMWEEWCSSRLE